jgi:uncharacterized protein
MIHSPDNKNRHKAMKVHRQHKKLFLPVLLIALFVLPGCRSYYQLQQEFHSHFQSGNIKEAAGVLENDRRAERRRTRLLHLMNLGVVEQMLGNYYRSNQIFEEAYLLGQDYKKDLIDEALALLTNPKVTEYSGEHFELLMIHYYKAMNFIHLGDMEAALVECRRLNIGLAALEDRYQSDNRYRRDAFIHNLMGVIHDATGDYNNAFIAYRNALEIYENDYTKLFGVTAPEQLKRDLLRAAHRTGFRDQVAYFEKHFNMKLDAETADNTGELVFFWQNGLGPVKQEQSIMFTLVRGSGGVVHFQNEDAGLSFAVPVSEEASNNLGDLRVVRMAFPKYAERRPVYTSARLKYENVSAPLYKAQSINGIAFKSLEDRMLREMGTALLRLAIRQVAEQQIRKEDQVIGAIFGVLGAIAEQADTRNWQTLPHSIHYTRMTLPEGAADLSLELILPNNNVARTVQLQTDIRAGHTTFMNFHTLDAKPPGVR